MAELAYGPIQITLEIPVSVSLALNFEQSEALSRAILDIENAAEVCDEEQN